VSFALTGGLMRILCSVVEIPVLTMLHSRKNLSLRCSVALEFVGDDHARYISQSLEELAEELLRSSLIPPFLHEDIQHVPVLINCPPEIVMLALDGEKHLVHVPFVTRSGTATPKLIGIRLTKLATPLADGLIGYGHAALKE
jgi:hypothetical protein